MVTGSWCDEYNINVAQLDVQHKMLLRLVDNIHDAVEARVDKMDLKDLLVELVEFSRMHFSMEEQLMKKYDSPDLEKHQNEHGKLLQHLNELVTVVANGTHPAIYSDYDISADWALIHIAEQDNSLGIFLNSKGVY